MGATLFDKIWSEHRLAEDEGGKTLLYIDRVVVDDVRAPQVLKNLERRALAIRRPDLAVVVQDHSVHPSRPIPALAAASSLMRRARRPAVMVFGFSMWAT